MPLVAGELETDDFLLKEASKTSGEPLLEELDRSRDWLLIVRSRGKEMGAGAKAPSAGLDSSSGNSEYQSLVLEIIGSPVNIGEHSKLSLRKGESPMSGEVKFVNAAEGGADPKASAKMSLGDTVRVEPAPTDRSLIAVNADIWSMVNEPDWKPGIRLAPESNELLLFKSVDKVSLKRGSQKACTVPAIVAALFCCGRLLLELENRGTGGRWRNRGCWNSVVDVGAEFA